MNETDRTSFSERLKTAAEAKKALMAGFRPKPSVVDPQFLERAAARKAELQQVRQTRTEEKAAKKQAVADALEAARLDAEASAAEALAHKRGVRKERKALSEADAKVKRDARYAARKSRK